MPNYIPKAEQIDVLNEKLTAINDTLKKKNDFTDAVKNLKDVTTKAEEATEKATAAAESVVSPTATVTKTGDTTTITITDKTGTTTAEVKDGSDATVTKDNIVSALGYEPVKPEGNYELIENVTTTEEISAIKITGSFKALYIQVVSPGLTDNVAANVTVNLSNGNAMYCWEVYGIQAASGRVTAYSAFVSGNRATYTSWRLINRELWYSYAPNYTSGIVNANTTITSITIGMTVPVGTTYYVYAIRA